ncbi:aminotransferase DegT [Methanomicrobiaceae archaeon CYW5]|uniref:DegT/DnrJ/EryC1/StrS family aminotransferase n=1 Tax=Methanovulcanius yangii TaxID=1789227 RepID=UPI0029CA0045|nr:DegT/DnrJ/EryC1/StrS family aminotransferase [Methanovulcanius yangii]MBT8507878.1 aminotransferase DegT [Methanovulcanius yangii]
MIPVARPFLGEEEIAAVAEVMQSGMLAQGEVVTAFEEEFAAYCETKHGVAVNSGTAALHAALLALGIGPGDEVIVPSFTFIATATSVSMCGARPVMVDVEPSTYTIDPEAVRSALSPATKAVIGVHLFGQPFDIDPVLKICEEKGLVLIEDCAQAHGATYRGKKVGGFGDVGCFSFYPTKNMTSGEGGMVTMDDAELASHIRRIINHGQSDKYLHTELGYNFRMTNIGAAIGRVQLGKLDAMNARRVANAEWYNSHIQSQGIATPVTRPGATHVYHQYVLDVDEECPLSRDGLMAYLREKDIGSAVHYPMPVHRQPLYAENGNGDSCPISDSASQHVLSLPVHPGVGREECLYIAEILNGVK